MHQTSRAAVRCIASVIYVAHTRAKYAETFSGLILRVSLLVHLNFTMSARPHHVKHEQIVITHSSVRLNREGSQLKDSISLRELIDLFNSISHDICSRNE